MIRSIAFINSLGRFFSKKQAPVSQFMDLHEKKTHVNYPEDIFKTKGNTEGEVYYQRLYDDKKYLDMIGNLIRS